MDVKTVADGVMEFIGLGVVAAVVGPLTAWASNYSRQILERMAAYRDWKRNPHAHVGAGLFELKDGNCRTLMGRSVVVEARRGRVVLRGENDVGEHQELVLTIREFQAGHAYWDRRNR